MTKLYYFTANEWDSFCIAYNEEDPRKFRMTDTVFYGEDEEPEYIMTWPVVDVDSQEIEELLETVTKAATDTDYIMEDGSVIRLYATSTI